MFFRLLVFLFLTVGSAPLAWGAVGTAPQPREGYKSIISGGVSAGLVGGREADFWGWSLSYGRLFSDPWGIDFSLLWDRETETRTLGQSKTVDSYTVSSTISYAVSENFGLAAGLGLGVASNDNPARQMEFEQGDVSAGLIGTYSFPRLNVRDRGSVSISFSAEYNISQKEPSVSVDLVFGWSL